jgi:hypothetical protein
MLFRHPTHKAGGDEGAASAKGGEVLQPELSKISLKPKELAVWGSFRRAYIAAAATLSVAGTAIAQEQVASISELASLSPEEGEVVRRAISTPEAELRNVESGIPVASGVGGTQTPRADAVLRRYLIQSSGAYVLAANSPCLSTNG